MHPPLLVGFAAMMPDSAAARALLHWFRVAKVADLILPDGWFGRPYDNQLPLTHLEARPRKLLLELDTQLLLVFTDLKLVSIENSRLVLTDFVQIVFDWQEYGSFSPHAKVYHSGAVTLVPPIGITVVDEICNGRS